MENQCNKCGGSISLDSIYSKKINELIEKGNNSRKQMNFDKSIEIFKDSLNLANKVYDENKKSDYIKKIENLILQTQIAKIKNTILSLGVKFDRLHVSEIAERCNESEKIIIKSVLDEIDNLMRQYKRWGEVDSEKKS